MHSSPLLYVYILSLVPTFEGRYALLTGVALGLTPLESLIVSSLGVVTLSLILPYSLFYLDCLIRSWGNSKFSLFRKISAFYSKYIISTRKRASKYVERYGSIGLIIFVSIPLPATGVWTGALAGFLMGISREKMVILLLIGGLLSVLYIFVPTYVISSL